MTHWMLRSICCALMLVACSNSAGGGPGADAGADAGTAGLAGPDLEVLGVTPTPAMPAPGQAVTLSVLITNRGDTEAAANTVTQAAVGSTTLEGSYASPIAAGSTVSVPLLGTWTSISGTTTVTATADATHMVAESDETNNVLAASLTAGRGATMPWDEYEAEGGVFTGTVQAGTWAEGTLSGEASRRAAVTLTGASQYVQWTSLRDANAIVVRFSVPDHTSNQLAVLVNGTRVTTMNVNSDFSWLYSGLTNTALNQPSQLQDVSHPLPHHIYDECNALLSSTGEAVIHAGDVVRLQPVNATPAITVDFADLELVAAPLTAPASYVTVTGLTQADVQSAITAAVNGAKPGVFLPAGTYTMNSPGITVPAGLTIQGAGMWHTRLTGGLKNLDFGFKVSGDGATFQDFALWGAYDTRVDGYGRAFGGNMHNNTSVIRVWMERWVVGGWIQGGSNLLVQDCRIRDTMADGINFANGTQNSRMLNSTARNNGDDGFAMWSATDLNQGSDFGNLIQNCTSGLQWRAAALAIYGGHDNTIDNCYAYDTLRYSGLTIDTEFVPIWGFTGTTTLSNLTIDRCGGLMWWNVGDDAAATPRRKWAAIWLFAADSGSFTPFEGIRISNVDVIDPVFQGIMVQGITGDLVRDTILDEVHITMNRSGEYGIVADDSHQAGAIGPTGAITFSNSSITGSLVTSANMFFKDSVSTGFTFTDGGRNSWTGNK